MDYGLSKTIRQDDERQLLWARQREERGFDDTETWSLEVPLAKFMLPRLIRYKEIHPHRFFYTYEEDLSGGYDKADDIRRTAELLDKIIYSFDCLAREDRTPENIERIQEGLDLFRENIFHLWW